MEHYVSMLSFDEKMACVALLHKTRPRYLAGKVCPTGGRIEDGETALQACVREHQEECGVVTAPEDWLLYTRIAAPTFTMDCFYCLSPEVVLARTTTDEVVQIFEVASVIADACAHPEKYCPDFVALLGLVSQHKQTGRVALIHYEEDAAVELG